jgi:predicted helicase
MAYDLDEEDIKKKFSITDIKLKSNSKKPKFEWKISEAREKLRSKGIDESLIIPYNYRPFDVATTYYSDHFLSRTRKKIMTNFLGKKNLGLLIGRAGQNVKSKEWDLVLVTDIIPDQNIFYRGGATIFPLYTYSGLLGKESNFTHHFIEFMSKTYPNSSPEQIFSYIYAVLNSKKYGMEYADFLDIDYPRIPFTKDIKKFEKLSELGTKLIDLHTMKAKTHRGKFTYGIEGTDKVESLKFENSKIFINSGQYFGGVSDEIWQFQLGGYQVAEKWLKDRIGKELTLNEIQRYLEILGIISETIILVDQIDKIDYDSDIATTSFEIHFPSLKSSSE